MTRPLRIDPPGGVHHVTNRGHRKYDIVLDADDYATFERYLGRVCERFKLAVLSLCVMPNHVHLVVDCREGNLSAALQALESSYARRFNFSHGFSGPLFTSRFHSELIDSDEYLRQAIRYVIRNPLELGYTIEDYAWSTYASLLGLRPVPTWLDAGRVLEVFGGREALRRFVATDQPTDKATYDNVSRPMVPLQRQWRSAGGLEAIESSVRDTVPAVPDCVRPLDRRDIAMTLATRYGIDSSDIAERYRITPSSVRSAMNRLRHRLNEDVLLRRWLTDADVALADGFRRPG